MPLRRILRSIRCGPSDTGAEVRDIVSDRMRKSQRISATITRSKRPLRYSGDPAPSSTMSVVSLVPAIRTATRRPACLPRSQDSRLGATWKDCAAGLGWLLAVGVLDYNTGHEISFSILYIPAILYVAWRADRRSAVAMAILATAIWLGVELHTHAPFSHPLIPWWNAFARGMVFLGAVAFARVLRTQEAQLRAVVESQTMQLREAAERRRALEREMLELTARQYAQFARDIHDGVGQYLSGLGFRAHILAEDLERVGSPHAAEARRLIELIRMANREARLLNEVHQTRSEAEDLPAALRRLVDDVHALFGVTCEAELPQEPLPLPSVYADTLYRIAQEALSNAVKHARAGRVRLSLTRVADEWHLAITDTGPGLVASESSGGAGLKIMRYRAELIGARLTISNGAAGGCRVECRFSAQPPASPAPESGAPR